MRVFRPFIRLLNFLGRGVLSVIGLRSRGRQAMVHSEEELKMLVTASQEAGVLEEQEEQMLQRVFGFADIKAGQIKVPRTELVAIPSATPVTDLIRLLAACKDTRVPVYRNDLDDVVGMLHVTDIIKALASGDSSVTAGAIAREVLTVPETLGADDLLAEMRRRSAREALVIDEYGGTAGMVTFESLMERIVGEVPGQTGSMTARIAVRADGSADVDGLALVADVNEPFGLPIDEDTYTTAGGAGRGRAATR